MIRWSWQKCRSYPILIMKCVSLRRSQVSNPQHMVFEILLYVYSRFEMGLVFASNMLYIFCFKHENPRSYSAMICTWGLVQFLFFLIQLNKKFNLMLSVCWLGYGNVSISSTVMQRPRKSPKILLIILRQYLTKGGRRGLRSWSLLWSHPWSRDVGSLFNQN